MPPIMPGMRRAFVRRLPKPVRWLWYSILAVIVAELVALAVGIVVGDAWLFGALEMASLLAAPLGVGLLIVMVCAAFVKREPDKAEPASARAEPARAPAERPAAPAPSSPEPAGRRGVAPEVAAGRAAGQAVAALRRSREGQAAIKTTSSLLRAVRAAAQAPPQSAEEGRDKPRSS